MLEEADQMLDIGLVHTLRRIARMLGKNRQTMMFSATMPKAMADLSRDYLSDPVRADGPQGIRSALRRDTEAAAPLGAAEGKALHRQITATRKGFHSEAALFPQEDWT